MAFKLFGAVTPDEKKLLTEILKDADPAYTRWAIDAIIHWKNEERVSAFRIHGDADLLFPIRNVNPDFIVAGGGHLMVVSHAKEIQNLILKVLNT